MRRLPCARLSLARGQGAHRERREGELGRSHAAAKSVRDAGVLMGSLRMAGLAL